MANKDIIKFEITNPLSTRAYIRKKLLNINIGCTGSSVSEKENGIASNLMKDVPSEDKRESSEFPIETNTSPGTSRSPILKSRFAPNHVRAFVSQLPHCEYSCTGSNSITSKEYQDLSNLNTSTGKRSSSQVTTSNSLDVYSNVVNEKVTEILNDNHLCSSTGEFCTSDNIVQCFCSSSQSKTKKNCVEKKSRKNLDSSLAVDGLNNNNIISSNESFKVPTVPPHSYSVKVTLNRQKQLETKKEEELAELQNTKLSKCKNIFRNTSVSPSKVQHSGVEIPLKNCVVSLSIFKNSISKQFPKPATKNTDNQLPSMNCRDKFEHVSSGATKITYLGTNYTMKECFVSLPTLNPKYLLGKNTNSNKSTIVPANNIELNSLAISNEAIKIPAKRNKYGLLKRLNRHKNEDEYSPNGQSKCKRRRRKKKYSSQEVIVPEILYNTSVFPLTMPETTISSDNSVEDNIDKQNIVITHSEEKKLQSNIASNNRSLSLPSSFSGILNHTYAASNSCSEVGTATREIFWNKDYKMKQSNKNESSSDSSEVLTNISEESLRRVLLSPKPTNNSSTNVSNQSTEYCNTIAINNVITGTGTCSDNSIIDSINHPKEKSNNGNSVINLVSVHNSNQNESNILTSSNSLPSGISSSISTVDLVSISSLKDHEIDSLNHDDDSNSSCDSFKSAVENLSDIEENVLDQMESDSTPDEVLKFTRPFGRLNAE